MRGKVRAEPKMKVRSFQDSNLTLFPRLSLSVHFTELNVSGNPILSFKGLLPYPTLSSLNCDNTKISSFLGAVYLPSLTSVTFNNAPISRYPHYRIMAGIVFGAQLERVDFWSIKKSEKGIIETLTPSVRDYLVDGWILTMIQPIKMFHAQTRKRKVIYVKEYRNVPTSPRPRTMVSRKQRAVGPATFKAIEIVDESSIDFVEQLQKLLYESDLRNLGQKVGEIKPKLNHECPENGLVFVHEVLSALNRRPAFFHEICELLVSCCTGLVTELLKDELMDFPFASHGLLCRLLERLFDEMLIDSEDVQSFFYSIYDSFDKFADKAHLHEKLPLEPFYRIFGNFYELIDEVDHSLSSSLVTELDKEGPEMKEHVDKAKWGDKYNALLNALKRDDVTAFGEYSDEDVGLFLANFFNIETSQPKLVASAFAGALNCFKAQQFVEEPNIKLCALQGGNPDIIHLVGDASPEGAIEYHSYQLFRSLRVANQDCVEAAVKAQNYDALSFLISSHVAIDPRYLRDAISNSNCELVDFLLRNGVTCDDGLELAVKAKHPMLVRNLVASGRFDVNRIFGNNEWTVLHLAASQGDVKTLEVLLNAKGIDPSEVDVDGQTAEDIANASGNQDVIKVFSLYGESEHN